MLAIADITAEGGSPTIDSVMLEAGVRDGALSHRRECGGARLAARHHLQAGGGQRVVKGVVLRLYDGPCKSVAQFFSGAVLRLNLSLRLQLRPCLIAAPDHAPVIADEIPTPQFARERGVD